MHPLTLLLPGLVTVLPPAQDSSKPATPPPAVKAPANPAPVDLAIVGARLELGNGTVIESGTILVRGGKIAAIGADVAVPAGMRTIDGKGLVVFPGFIDAYATTGLKLADAPANVGALPDTLNTAPATMWAGNRKGLRADIRAAASLDPAATWEDRARQGVTTLLLSGGVGSIAGTAALVDLTPAPTVIDADAAEEFVLRGGGRFGGYHDDDMAGAQGAPAPTQTPNPSGTQTPAPGQAPTPGQGRGPQPPAAPTGYPYPGTLFGITALVRQTLWDAKAYAAQKELPKDAKPDPTYEGLRPLVTGRMPAMFTVSTSRDISRAAHLSDEFGFRMIVNGAPDAYRMADVLKREKSTVVVSLDVPDEPTRKPGTGADATPLRVLEDRVAQYKERMANARLLDAAGIPILFRKGPDDYLVGVRKLVTASGLSRDAALRAMTLGAAQAFGVAAQLGTLEVGKRANLVVLSGDFLDEKTTVKTTLVDGVEIAPKPAEKPADKPAEKPAPTAR